MTAKFTNTLQDFITDPQHASLYKKWGCSSLMSMGDGIRFRVRNSPCVDYVTIRYLSGYEQFEIEFGALVGTEYDLLDRLSPISKDELMDTIDSRIFFD